MSSATDAQRVITACFEGDAATVKALVGAEPALANARFPALDSTALHISAHRGFQEIVDVLLAHGADPDAREGCSGATPLHWAAEGGQVGVVEALLARGALLDARDTWHAQQPIDWASWVVQSPHLHVDRAATAALLAARGARPSLFSCIATGRADDARELVAREPRALEARLGPLDGEVTPLLFALERRATDMAALLLDLGADAGVTDARGLGARALAQLAGDRAALELLAERRAPAELSFLVTSDDLHGARETLDREPGSLASGGRYHRLLPALVLRGLLPPVTFLLEHGADPAAGLVCLDFDEWIDVWPALLLAASRGQLACARRLLDAGAAPDARAPRSLVTALHVAAACGQVDFARELLARGADANAPARGAVTPLHRAACAGSQALVELLLAAGAARAARDDAFHATPAGWAKHGGHAELAALLE